MNLATNSSTPTSARTFLRDLHLNLKAEYLFANPPLIAGASN
jgi:hypothetical protein